MTKMGKTPSLIVFWVSCAICISASLVGCNTISDESVVFAYGSDKINSPFSTIRETCVSVNGGHQIQTFVTRASGMGVIVDGGTKMNFDDFSVRYKPCISNDGFYAWIVQTPGKGYDVVWQGNSVGHSSGAVMDHLKSSCTKAVFVESGANKSVMHLYMLDMNTGKVQRLSSYEREFIEDIAPSDDDTFGLITCKYSGNGEKSYNLYLIDGNTAEVILLQDDITDLIRFPHINHSENLTVDFIQMSDNVRYLFNALTIFGESNDAFALGNNFRGRITWEVSYRIRGLVELYKKTGDQKIYERINEVVDGVLGARNQYVGITADNYNPGFLWSAKSYTIDQSAACILVDDAEILSSLLFACEANVVNKRSEVVSSAVRAYDYYARWYKNGHYYSPYGWPVQYDGIVVPWNYQNSMGEVALSLYKETGDEKYLRHCNELISAFMADWYEESDRIFWHYWPHEFYDGWLDDGRSIHSPSVSSSTDALYEDISHAGISVRFLCRYFEFIPDGIVKKKHIQKIEENMNYFLFKDGFHRYMSGVSMPRDWCYGISPYWSYLKNECFENYVRQGYLKIFPSWDLSGSLFANAKFYEAQTLEPIKVSRKRILGGGDS